MRSELEQIKDFVFDHFKTFGAYPLEVETKKQIYTWDQYWLLMDGETANKKGSNNV